MAAAAQAVEIVSVKDAASIARHPAARTWFALYLAFVAAFSIWMTASLTNPHSPYLIGEWLINYSGGFVRRGLLGSLVLLAGHVTGFQLIWLVFSLQVATFLLFLGCVYKLTEGMRWTYWLAAILLSPATLAFTVMEPFAGFRKEVLLFAGLAAFLCVLASGRLRDWQLSVFLSCLIVALTLSHEALIVCGPYFFAGLVLHTRSLPRALKISIAPAILCIMALFAALTHPGNHQAASAICSSIGGTLPAFNPQPTTNPCSGSILWLQLSLPEARGLIVPIIRDHHFVRLFALLAFPTFVPMIYQLIIFYRRDHLRLQVKVIACCAVLSLIGLGFLFYSALDWGRWFHMEAVSLMLVIMMAARSVTPRTGPGVASTLPAQDRREHRFASIAALVLYSTSWTLPSIGLAERHGYLNVALFVYSSARDSIHAHRPLSSATHVAVGRTTPSASQPTRQ